MISQMNDVLKEWSTQYDIFSSVSLSFHKDADDRICLNEKVLCFATDLTLYAAHFDASGISFWFDNDYLIFLTIAWPEDEEPHLRDVYCGYGPPPEDEEEKI